MLNISKKDKTKDYWPRLTHQNKKNQFITIDWSKWKDPDDEDAVDPGIGDFDPK